MLQFSAVLNSAFTVSQRSHIFYCYSNRFGVAQHYFVFIKNPTLSIPVHEGGGSFEVFPSLHWGTTQGGMLVFEK